MKQKILAILLVFCMVLPLAGCVKAEPAKADPQDIFSALMDYVAYDTPLSDYSDSGATAYAGMPAGTKITMYSGNALYADELTWIEVSQEADLEKASEIVDKHLDEKYDQYLSYHAEEVPKIESALLWKDSTNIILCITNDYDTAKALMEDPNKLPDTTKPAATQPPTEAPTEEQTEAPTEPPTEAPTEPATEPTTEDNIPKNEEGYPAITTDSTYRHKGNAMIVDNQAFEYYLYDQYAAESYTSLVNRTAQLLDGQSSVYCMVIPTAIGIIFPDNLQTEYTNYEYQGQRLEQIYAMLDDKVIQVDLYDKLMTHRNEYLYFRTDWHWTGIGAYYGYERFCEVKGITPYTMADRTERIYEGYLGPLYSQTTGKDPALKETPDTVYAYEPYYQDVSMVFTDTNGNQIAWPVISDGDDYSTGSKYIIFAAGDQPFAEFKNPNITDGSVAIVVKESFGNAMMSYIVDHYSTVYEIDYRYWEGDLVNFAHMVGADDIIFANHIGMVRTSYLIGLMDRIIP